MAEKQFDLIVIGAGPGGYVAAIKAAQLGMKTAVVEKRKSLGGTCLNVGCIPSKALLHSSHLYAEAKEHMAEHGIITKEVKLDLAAMLKRKDGVVDGLTKGIDGLFKKNKITRFEGHGKITAANEVTVDDKETLKAKNILIATGSDVVSLPGIDIDEKQIVSSTGALRLNKVPERMVVIGGGYIGLEMGSVWSRLGAEVTVVEYADRIVPGMDQDVSKQFYKILGKQGLNFKLKTKVTQVKTSKKEVTLTLEPAAGGDSETMKADIVLVAIGRKPYTDNLGLEDLGIDRDDRGRIKTNGQFQTSVNGIYAIGDVIDGPMLAHKAEEEGVACVEILAGQKPHIDYNLIPGVVYTNPEVASVGKTEAQLKEANIPYNVGSFPYMANSRARANGINEGLVKILAHKETDKVLGAHIVGPEAGSLIHEFVILMEFHGSAEDIYRSSHAHPTFAEAIKEAAMAVQGKPIHI